MNRFRKQTFAAIALVGALAVTQFSGAARSKSDAESVRDARKADYVFMEALKYKGEGLNDAYYDMVARAYELNPSDSYIGKEFGIKLIVENSDDSIRQEQGLKLMRTYVDEAPGDIYATVNYASIASQLGYEQDALDAWHNLYVHNPTRVDVATTYADALASTGKMDNMRRALEIYNSVESSEGVNTSISTRKMQVFHGMSDTAAVKREARNLLASWPRSAEYITFVGTIYAQMGDNDSALVFFDRALDVDPSSGVAYYNRAKYFSMLGDSVAYDREVFNALQQPDLDMEPKLGILRDYVMELYSDSTQHERIDALFQSLIEQYPHEVEVRNLYGGYLIAISDYARAVEQVSYALDADPSDLSRWNMLASLYYQLMDYRKVVDTALNGLRYFPSDLSLYQVAASASTQQKDYAGAMVLLESAMAVVDSTDMSGRSELISAMGDTYYASGQPDSAFVYYQKALELDHNNLLALNNCAYHMACEGKELDKALAMIEKVVAEKPDDDTSLDTYAWVLFKMKNYPKAKEIIDSTIEVTTEPSADVFEHAGDIYFMNGMPDEALDFWKKALELDPDKDVLKRKVKHKTFFFK